MYESPSLVPKLPSRTNHTRNTAPTAMARSAAVNLSSPSNRLVTQRTLAVREPIWTSS